MVRLDALPGQHSATVDRLIGRLQKMDAAIAEARTAEYVGIPGAPVCARA